jgi:hypothetical protein
LLSASSSSTTSTIADVSGAATFLLISASSLGQSPSPLSASPWSFQLGLLLPCLHLVPMVPHGGPSRLPWLLPAYLGVVGSPPPPRSRLLLILCFLVANTADGVSDLHSLEAMFEPLELPDSLLPESQPPVCPSSSLPITVKSRTATSPAAQQRGRGTNSSRGCGDTKPAERAEQEDRYLRKRSAGPLPEGATELLNLATPPSLVIYNSSQHGTVSGSQWR